MSLKSSSHICILLAGLVAGFGAEAAEHRSDLRLSGFVTQGYFLTDHNNIYGDSEEGSLDFREVGVNGLWRMRPDLQLAAQLMSRRAGEVDDGDLRFDYLLLDWRLLDDPGHQNGLRLGRLKVPMGLYNDTRDVAFTRPSILLPQEIYFDYVRNIALSLDGGGYYQQLLVNDYRLDLNIVAGEPWDDDSINQVLGGLPGRFDGGTALTGRLMVGDLTERWKAGISVLSFDLDYHAGNGAQAPFFVRDGEFGVDVAVLSAQYNWERLTLSSEYMRLQSDWRQLGGVFAQLPEWDYEAYYLQAQYRFRPGWDLILRYGEAYADRHDRSGREFQAQAGPGIPAFTRYAKDLTLGLGWQPTPSWLLRAELHRVRGTLWLPGLDNPDVLQLEKEWNLFALQASYRF